ncbi:hypothetical protein DENIS_3090 [Desulfonema ishimotonii]|uniref:SPOR domain-containing protein n=1 Tax=Desulfonema ishimotonii TaxID=45657 RepID=A0A401FYV1_9BACT|nr:SPOR domain-containing protein [Desulfonema ishimotonii]GBC62127.1 hypothetical protein DENIS_3090 [Desulfonema ishimotonii]
MSYDFSLDKKKGALLMLAFISLAFLFFAAGWLSHAVLSPSQPEAIAPASESRGGRMAVGRPVPSAVPQVRKPTIVDNVLRSVRTAVSNPASLLARKAASDKKAGEKKAESSPAGDSSARKTDAAEPEKNVGEETADAQKAEPADQSAPGGQKKSADSVRFSVEVESFVLKDKAQHSVKALKKKGFDACMIRMGDTDAESKTWYVVQIGDYDHLSAAYAAASDFEKKEKKVAVIRTMKPHILEAGKICE